MPPESPMPGVHWDFMLEVEGSLRTWRLEKPPESAESIAAEELADHRLSYLDYEGPVSGNRGVVTRHDAGSYHWLIDHANRVEVQLDGDRLRGTASLHQEASQPQRWTFSFSPSADTSCRPDD